MAIDPIQRVAHGDMIARAGSRMNDITHSRRRPPVVVLLRSLAMVALAGLGILVVLPAAIAAQAASAL